MLNVSFPKGQQTYNCRSSAAFTITKERRVVLLLASFMLPNLRSFSCLQNVDKNPLALHLERL